VVELVGWNAEFLVQRVPKRRPPWDTRLDPGVKGAFDPSHQGCVGIKYSRLVALSPIPQIKPSFERSDQRNTFMFTLRSTLSGTRVRCQLFGDAPLSRFQTFVTEIPEG
jgi:hypothetical protein